MNRLSTLCTVFVLSGAILIFLGCSEEPYVEQINKAHDLINQGKLENSREKLKAAVEEYSKAYSYALFAVEKKYDALYNLGVLHAYNGEYQYCIQVMTQAYEIRRDEPSFFYYWGMCYANEAKIALESSQRRENIDKAIKVYQLGLDLDPKDHQLNYGMGVLYGFITDDYPRAMEYLTVAHNANPDDINTLFALANLNYRLGRAKDSIDYFQTIMRLSKPDTPSYRQAQENLSKIR